MRGRRSEGNGRRPVKRHEIVDTDEPRWGVGRDKTEQWIPEAPRDVKIVNERVECTARP